MGLRENFTQAVKELTGSKEEANKQPSDKKGVQVEDLKRAVNEESPDIREDFAPFDIEEDTQNDKSESHISEELNLGKIELAEKKIESVPAETPQEQPVLTQPQQSPSVSSNRTASAQPLPQPQFNQQQPQFNQQQPQFNQQQPQFSQPQPFVQPQQQPVPPVQNTQNVRDFQNAPPLQSGYAANSSYSGYQENKNIWDKPYYSSYQPSATNYSDAEITLISKNTVIDGNIRSFANMSIDGDIKGDVETTKNIEINGKIVGNITCNNAEMHSSQIQGNVRMKGNVIMERDTLLIGDLVSTYAKVNGKVKGNLDVVGKAELKSDSVVFGDISASTITVDDGAIIQGYVSTTFLNKEESRNIFPDAISVGESINNS